MKYIGILVALSVVCLLAAPALSVGNGKGTPGAQEGNAFGTNNGQCGDCQCNGPCSGTLMAQNQFGQDNGDCQGAGICDQDRERDRDGSCDGTGPKRDGSCAAA